MAVTYTLSVSGDIIFGDYENGKLLVYGRNDNSFWSSMGYSDVLYEIKDLIQTIEVASSVLNFAAYGASSFSNLETVILHDGITSIGSNAFANCSNLTTINWPSSLKSIGEYAFVGTGLKSINFPSNLTSIGKLAFEYCDLTHVTIPISVTTFGEGAFYECNNLVNVYYEGTLNDWFNLSFGNSSSNPLNNGANLYCNNELIEELPDYINIPDNSFYGCTSLKKVGIVSSIGDYGLAACPNLSQVSIPKQSSLGSNCFSGNSTAIYLELYSFESEPSSWDSNWKKGATEIVYNTKPNGIAITGPTVFKSFDTIEDIYNTNYTATPTYDGHYLENPGIIGYVGATIVGYRYENNNYIEGDDTLIYFVVSYHYIDWATVTYISDLGDISFSITVEKLIPEYTIPETYIDDVKNKPTLSSFVLPTGFSFSEYREFSEPGEYIVKAIYTPPDIINYKIVEDIPISIRLYREFISTIPKSYQTQFNKCGCKIYKDGKWHKVFPRIY